MSAKPETTSRIPPIPVEIDPTIPPGEMHARVDGKTIGKIVNMKQYPPQTTKKSVHFSKPAIWLRVQWYNWIARPRYAGRITVDDVLKELNHGK